MPLPFIAQLAIGIVLNFIGYLLMPKPKQPKPPGATEQEKPTAEAGRPIPVVFGSMTLSGPNILGYWDLETLTREISVSESKK